MRCWAKLCDEKKFAAAPVTLSVIKKLCLLLRRSHYVSKKLLYDDVK